MTDHTGTISAMGARLLKDSNWLALAGPGPDSRHLGQRFRRGGGLMSTVTEGTFTLTYRHGTSDALAHDVSASVVQVATDIAVQRDNEIQAEHDADPELAAGCLVCNPPPGIQTKRPSRLSTFFYRLRGAWTVLRGGDW